MSEDAVARLPSPVPNTKPSSNNVTLAYSSLPSPTSSHSHSPPSETYSSSSTRPSSSRVVNPAPIATRPAPRVVIATAASTQHEHALASPVGGGPTSASYVVPPRPKPGRKPATDEPASKRKAQNRESQRAFRARKAAKLTEMQSQVDIAEQRHQQELNEKVMEIRDKEMLIRQLESRVTQLQESDQRTAQERDFWKDKARQLEEFVANTAQAYDTPKAGEFVCSVCKTEAPRASLPQIAKPPDTSVFTDPVPLALGPPRSPRSSSKIVQDHGTSNDSANSFTEREIDFTAQFATRKPRVDTRPSIAFLTEPNEDDSQCGFCTDESNCLCRDASLQDMQRSSDGMAPSTRGWAGTTPNEDQSSPNEYMKTGPGTCTDCLRDPKQRAWCQRVAQLKSSDDYFGRASASRNSSITSELEPMEPRMAYAPVSDRNSSNQSSIGCSDAYRLFDGRVPTDQENMDWSTLKPISPDTKRETLPSMDAARKYSALELDTAGVIATLQQTMGPLTPRKEDGKHADIVRIAEQHRRSSNSPMV